MMRTIACILAAAALVCACASDGIFGLKPSGTFTPGTALHSITVGSLGRDYVLHVPTNRPVSSTGTVMPYPLVIVLHGSSATGEDIRATTNMDSLAEVYHWVVAYPNGVSGAGGLFPSDWNAGTCCGAAGREDIDDVGFIGSVISQVSAKLPVNAKRIYVAGFSDGGRMAHHLACVMSDKIAAIGVVSGSLKDDHCDPVKPVPLLAVHGDADPIVPFDEAAETPPTADVSGAAAALPMSVQFWVVRNGCATGDTSTVSPHVLRTVMTKCTGADVIAYTINGGVHTWPVAQSPTGGDPDAELSASTVIAQFFLHHVLK